MLPARARLRRGDELRTVTRRGVRVRRDDLTVHLLPGPAFARDHPAHRDRLAHRDHPARTAPPARAAVVVGRAAGGAVERNRLRRRVRHGLADLWQQVPTGSQLVVRAGPGACRLTPAQLRAALAASLSLAGERAQSRTAGAGPTSAPGGTS